MKYIDVGRCSFRVRPPRLILKRLDEAYPTVTDSPVKALIINRAKNTR